MEAAHSAKNRRGPAAPITNLCAQMVMNIYENTAKQKEGVENQAVKDFQRYNVPNVKLDYVLQHHPTVSRHFMSPDSL